MDQQGGHSERLNRVESEVTTIRGEMAGLTKEMVDVRADVRGLGAILQRIEQGVVSAQERADHREVASKPNLAAVVSILITIIVTLISGSFVIGGQLARADERYRASVRELDQMHLKLDRVPVRSRERDVSAPPT